MTNHIGVWTTWQMKKKEQCLIHGLCCEDIHRAIQMASVDKLDCLMLWKVYFDIWLHTDFCRLTTFSLLPHTEKPVSVELSCGAGPSHVVLEPGLPLLLDCNLGASDAPFNVTWLQDGQPLPVEGVDFLQYLANGSLLLLPASNDGHPPQGVEGGYSCVSASALGALTSRTVNVLLASRCPADELTSPAQLLFASCLTLSLFLVK